MHLDFVEMGDDVKQLVFNHFVRLIKESAHCAVDVTIEELPKTFIINLPLRAIDEPDFIG